MKTALLVVSFGTTHLDTFDKTIAATEEALKTAFPELPFYRAFTSKIVRSRLLSKYGMTVDDVEGALNRIASDGITHVLIQPTLLIPGEEFDRLNASIRAAAGSLTVSVGKPLICDEPDMDRMIGILAHAYPLDEDSALLLMGHGTYHSANNLYEIMNGKMQNHFMRICTVEGIPSFADGVGEMAALKVHNVTLAPMLFVAGDHAKNDMAGDEPDSLRSLLEREGFTVTPVLQGLGELCEVQEFYVEKAKEAMTLLTM